MHILIVCKSHLKLQVFGPFLRFVRTLIIKISSSEEPANSTSIHKVRNSGKLVISFHPSPKDITKRCRSPSWKPANARWKYRNGAKRAERAKQIVLAHAQTKSPRYPSYTRDPWAHLNRESSCRCLRLSLQKFWAPSLRNQGNISFDSFHIALAPHSRVKMPLKSTMATIDFSKRWFSTSSALYILFGKLHI